MAPVPLSPGYHSVNPYIVVAGAARLIDFLFEVFGRTGAGQSAPRRRCYRACRCADR